MRWGVFESKHIDDLALMVNSRIGHAQGMGGVGEVIEMIGDVPKVERDEIADASQDERNDIADVAEKIKCAVHSLTESWRTDNCAEMYK